MGLGFRFGLVACLGEDLLDTAKLHGVAHLVRVRVRVRVRGRSRVRGRDRGRVRVRVRVSSMCVAHRRGGAVGVHVVDLVRG